MKRNEEFFTTRFEIANDGFKNGLNVEITDQGTIKKRKGYNTFGEMVHTLWELNKKAKKMGWSSDYTVRLPLRGTKPVYKKTLSKE